VEAAVDETMTHPGAAPKAAPASAGDRVPRLAWLIAAVFVVVELAVSDRYGFQQDELYFLVASHHLAFGYVDQPPLAVLLARTTDIFGTNPTAIRILPALAGGAIVVIAARLAALFGAGRDGRVLAALGTACAPVLMGATHIGNTTPYDLLAWAVVLLCVATALLRDRPRWWLGAGAAVGVGLENEYLIATLIGALVIGILLTSAHRRVLATPWPWLGGLVALVIWAPNLDPGGLFATRRLMFSAAAVSRAMIWACGRSFPSSRPQNRVCHVRAACLLAGAGSPDRGGDRGEVPG
jgi:hypothetical protein